MQSVYRCDSLGDAAMMPEDAYVFGVDDDELPEAEETLEMRHAVLKDVMGSYDLSFVLDVRDSMFASRLTEAARVLGIGMHLRVSPAEDIGHGMSRSTAVLELSYGSEMQTYGADALGTESDDAVLMAARRVMVAAGLLNGSGSCGSMGFEMCVPAE